MRLRKEKQTCPSRMNQWGPWDKKEMLDWWETDRWSVWKMIKDKIRNHLSWRKWDGRWVQTSQGGTEWGWPWKPRSCSFCGSVHPDDAIRLVQEGWEVESTGKSYKRYLNPPGYRKYTNSFKRFETAGEMVSKGRVGEHTEPLPCLPVPPVKVYVEHFSKEQVDNINAAMELAKVHAWRGYRHARDCAEKGESMITADNLKHWFTYHPLTEEKIPKYEAIREAGLAFATVILENTPASADQSAAIRLVREAVMTANAAVACDGK